RYCRSVYSPAAYLVDLLQFLNPRVPPPGVSQRPLEVLRQRRPDLEDIQLTCENTNTTLPYVDLVNEVLESYITLGHPPPHNTSTAATAEAPSINRAYSPPFPEAVTEAASTKLAQAVFPLSLPFDRYIESVRAYFAHLGSSRYELLKTFQKPGVGLVEASEYL